MTILQDVRRVSHDAVKRPYTIARNRCKDWLYQHRKLAFHASPISPAAAQYLRANNPKLLDLQRRYEEFGTLEHTFWRQWRTNLDLPRFRGEGQYLAQCLTQNPGAFLCAQAVFAEMIDDWNTLGGLVEDGAFGCHAYTIADGITVSRDLLDSILEITFLRKAMGWQQGDRIRVLDVGAGYGRFAHRFTSIFSNGAIANVDAVPESTFLCDFYTEFRGLTKDCCQTVALDRLSDLQAGFDIAINIHSWSECSRRTVGFWVRRIRDLGIRSLFVVPHDENFTTIERAGKDTFLPEIEAAGFRLALQSFKFAGSRTLSRIDRNQYYLFHVG